MRGFISLGAVVAILCGLFGVTAGSASAVDLGRGCAKVTTPKTGRYEDNACSKVSAPMEGEFLVEEAIKRNFTIASGIALLAVGGKSLTCQKGTGGGKSINDIQGEVTFTFEKCAFETGEKTCNIANIKTNTILTQRGTVAEAEATSKMGVLAKPKEKTVFAVLPASAECGTPETVVEGSIACEGAAQEKSSTGRVKCLVVEKAQKVKKINILAGGAKGEEVPNTPKLTAFGVAATLSTELTITFEEALTLFP
jgi:hypothetical protein